MQATIKTKAVLQVLDAVEDRLSLCALHFHRALEAETQDVRDQRLAAAKRAIGRANRVLAEQMAAVRRGLGLVRPQIEGSRHERRTD